MSNPPWRPLVIGSGKDSYALLKIPCWGFFNDLPSSFFSLDAAKCQNTWCGDQIRERQFLFFFLMNLIVVYIILHRVWLRGISVWPTCRNRHTRVEAEGYHVLARAIHKYKKTDQSFSFSFVPAIGINNRTICMYGMVTMREDVDFFEVIKEPSMHHLHEYVLNNQTVEMASFVRPDRSAYDFQ